MIRIGRTVAVVGSALAVAVAFGCGAASGVASKRAVSPCGTATAPAWSPAGTEIAWFGYRWPRPPNGHATGAYNILRAFCTSATDGSNLHPLPHTTCARALLQRSSATRRVSSTGSSQASSSTATTTAIYTISVGHKSEAPRPGNGPEPYAIAADGDRVAAGHVGVGCTTLPRAGDDLQRPVRRRRRRRSAAPS